MTAQDLISSTIIPVRTSDTGNSAMYVMSELKVSHLPVVNDLDLLGVISEEILLNYPLEEAIGSIPVMDGIVYSHQGDHLFDIMKLLVNQGLSAIPVVDEEQRFLGTIIYQDILRHFAQSYSMDETGTTLVIETATRDYSLGEISQIIESEGSRILCCYIHEQENLHRLLLSTRIDTLSPDRVISSLERYGYTILGRFQEEEDQDNLYRDRFDALMNYLNM